MADEPVDENAPKTDAKPATVAAAVPASPPATPAPAAPALVTFVPAKTFTGYPESYETNPDGVLFEKGKVSQPMPKEFVDLMREKSLVAEDAAAGK